jgi:undecaprenyl-diphosphatase
MEWLAVLVLAVVQGLTEFLPVSSDGHLTLVEGAFERLHIRAGDPLTLTIMLHAGTLVAVVCFYRREVWQLTRDWRTLGLVILATIPAVLFGLPMKYFAKDLLQSPLWAAGLLPVNGAMLLWASAQPRGDRDYRQLSWAGALAIGCGQALAVFPGISRSGCTISAALRLGLEPKAAAAFSFLLSIPVIGGACLLELVDVVRDPERLAVAPGVLLLGMFVAGSVGWFALRWLLAWVAAGKLYWFSWWCIALGVVALAWQLSIGPAGPPVVTG